MLEGTVKLKLKLYSPGPVKFIDAITPNGWLPDIMHVFPVRVYPVSHFHLHGVDVVAALS